MENISADPSVLAYLTTFLPLFFMLAISVALGFIPATIARKKGYSQGLFWLFGFFLFVPALIVACCIEDKTKPKPPTTVYVAQPYVQPYAPPAAPAAPAEAPAEAEAETEEDLGPFEA